MDAAQSVIGNQDPQALHCEIKIESQIATGAIERKTLSHDNKEKEEPGGTVQEPSQAAIEVIDTGSLDNDRGIDNDTVEGSGAVRSGKTRGCTL